jgi:hypothetical protein
VVFVKPRSDSLFQPEKLHALLHPVGLEKDRLPLLQRDVAIPAGTNSPRTGPLPLRSTCRQPAAVTVARVARVSADAERDPMVFMVIAHGPRQTEFRHLLGLEAAGVVGGRSDGFRVAGNPNGLVYILLRDLGIDGPGRPPMIRDVAFSKGD